MGSGVNRQRELETRLVDVLERVVELQAELARVTHERDWLVTHGPEGTADALNAYRAAVKGLHELRPASPEAASPLDGCDSLHRNPE